MSWSADHIGDQTGRRFIITGANGGLGSVTAKRLADKGGSVVLACRDVTKAERVAGEIGGDVSVAPLDLADLSSVRSFATGQGEFDVLINNAGLMNVPFRRTVDGFEMQFGVNHLGHFALTGLLLDRITDRVVTLSSIAHRQTPKLWIDDLDYRHRRYQRNLAYAQSKLANLMFARELERRLRAAGSSVRSYGVHPGVSGTDLFARTETVFDRVGVLGASLVGHPPEKAAESTLFAATEAADPEVFWGPTGLLIGSRGPVRPSRSTRLSRNRRLAARLWTESEKMTGIEYDFDGAARDGVQS
ncbi:SDR family NAD(P)-dependent oxidoreductase [Gordonia sp. PDNC005]|uniref:oxidoreductase n=1 Tax=unclassified Gordonia (in: high G+C Gram-positive bacteria) TaxID=2657482 RepID=UPI0019625069|nr:oxidoreductase [Gordonia sp. PDNC005]QRY62118.1 SDR family NAD(P)-dependent oxidoreductase [Gordonia sp. PDNC005]